MNFYLLLSLPSKDNTKQKRLESMHSSMNESKNLILCCNKKG